MSAHRTQSSFKLHNKLLFFWSRIADTLWKPVGVKRDYTATLRGKERKEVDRNDNKHKKRQSGSAHKQLIQVTWEPTWEPQDLKDMLPSASVRRNLRRGRMSLTSLCPQQTDFETVFNF